MTRFKSIARTAVKAVSAILIVCGLVLFGGIIWMTGAADNVPVSPRGAVAETASDSEIPWDFEAVDWEGWQQENPDIIGWVQVPGTEVSLPVARADGDDPEFYLDHDAYGNWNFAGTPFLDAECEGDFDCGCAVVLGHHLNNGTVFSELARYTDEEFAKEHPHILLQTKDWKRVYEVEFAEAVNASVPSKVCTFERMEDFSAFMDVRRGSADVVLKEVSPERHRALQLVTCSYGQYRNERTVVTATVAEEYRTSDSNSVNGQA